MNIEQLFDGVLGMIMGSLIVLLWMVWCRIKMLIHQVDIHQRDIQGLYTRTNTTTTTTKVLPFNRIGKRTFVFAPTFQRAKQWIHDAYPNAHENRGVFEYTHPDGMHEIILPVVTTHSFIGVAKHFPWAQSTVLLPGWNINRDSVFMARAKRLIRDVQTTEVERRKRLEREGKL
jgi:hypothetical protein